MKERDLRLTLIMGECWHEYSYFRDQCDKCLKFISMGSNNLSGEIGFFRLINFMKKQDWLEDFLNEMDVGTYIKTHDGFTFDMQAEFIDPDRLANALDKFLQERSDNETD